LLVLNVLKNNPRTTVTEIANTINLPETIVKVILEKSVESGLVEAFGNGKNRAYILSPAVYGTKDSKRGYVLQKDIDKKRHLELIVSLARENKFISKADVVKLLHVDENRAAYLIRKLVAQKVLEPVQKGRYANYRLVK